MGYESFYGGRRGASFIIAKNYKDIIAMVTDFAKGNNFSQVKYDEYVLINTVNKNHPDNGKLFRRGYDYNGSRTIEGYESLNENNEIIINGTDQDYKNASLNYNNAIFSGGAVYIGSIIGPSGNAPFLTFAPYDVVQNKIDMNADIPQDRRKSGAGTVTLLPGKEKNRDIYNDNILWNSFSILEPNHDNGQVFIGFKFPYLVTDFIKKDISPYEDTSITRIDNGEHPFYQQWEVAVPPGKQGNGIEEIKKVSLNFLNTNGEDENFPSIYERPTSENPMVREDYSRLGLTGDDEILVYIYKNYEEADIIQKDCYLGQYKQIKDIQITPEGYLIISYSNGVQQNFGEVVSTISKLSYNENNSGKLEIIYNTGQSVTIDIIYPTNFNLDEETGNLTFKNNNEDDDTDPHILGTLKWIDHIEYDNETKQIVIVYNTKDQSGYSEQERLSFPFVSNLNISEDGKVLIQKGQEWEEIENLTLKWIDHIEYSVDDNSLQIFYNNDSDVPGETIQNVFHKLESITFRESIEFQGESQTGPGFIFSYSDGLQEKVPFETGNLIKSIRLLPGAAYDEDETQQIRNTMLEITYTNNDIEEIELDGKLISNIYFIEGEVTKLIDQNNEKSNTITLPTSTLTIRYDNNTTKTFDDFTYPKSVKVFDDTLNSSHSIVIYDSQGEEIERSEPLTGIERMRIYNNRLLVLYNNPTARNNIPSERRVSILEEDGTTILVWDDLGVVRADSGILTGKNFTPAEIKEAINLPAGDELTEEDIITFLNSTYVDGTLLNGLYRVVTVGQENENKKFYGFSIGDTNLGTFSSWYYLGTIPNSASSQIDAVYGTKEEFESISDIKKASLRTGGMFFIVSGEDDQNNNSSEPEEPGEQPEESEEQPEENP